jgi:hypothetical protein
MQRAKATASRRSARPSSAKQAPKPGTRRPRCCGRPRRRLAGRSARGCLVEGRMDQPEERRDRGPARRGPFRITADPAAARSDGERGIDLALNAVSAIPVAGWIIGIVVGIGKALAALFKGCARMTSVDPEQRARLPWGNTTATSIRSGSARSSRSTRPASTGPRCSPADRRDPVAAPRRRGQGRPEERPRQGARALRQQDRRLQRHVRLPAGHLPRRGPPAVPPPPAAARHSDLRFYNDGRSSSSTATSRRPATSSRRSSSSPAPPGSRSRPAARTPTRSTARSSSPCGATGSARSTRP